MAAVWSHRRRDREVPDARKRPGRLDRDDSSGHRRLLRRRVPRYDTDGTAGAECRMDRLDHRRDGAVVRLPSDRRQTKGRLTRFVSTLWCRGPRAVREAFLVQRFVTASYPDQRTIDVIRSSELKDACAPDSAI